MSLADLTAQLARARAQACVLDAAPWLNSSSALDCKYAFARASPFRNASQNASAAELV